MNNYNALSLISDILQIVNYQLNVEQTSNDELMKELTKQDSILNEQISTYLKKIIQQNEQILTLLKKGENDA